MSTEPTIEVFDQRGKFILPDPAVYSTLSPDRKERFLELKAAAEEEKAAEAALKEASIDVGECAHKVRAAQAVLIALRPKVSAVDEAKWVIKSQREAAGLTD
jgi:hypothetical protein